MKMIPLLTLLITSICGTALGQRSFYLQLEGAKPNLSIPVMAISPKGISYVAYRIFSRAAKSDSLALLAFDVQTGKEIGRTAVPVSQVRGARVSGGLYISEDGRTVAYAELYDPIEVLTFSADGLMLEQRTETLPFSALDRQRTFAGFASDNSLCFAANVWGQSPQGGVHLVRMANIKPLLDKVFPQMRQATDEEIHWIPSAKTLWLSDDENWFEYGENGDSTGNHVSFENAQEHGATPLGLHALLAYYGKWADGTVVRYEDKHQDEVHLQCSPHPYGKSGDSQYAGGICQTNPDREAERGGNRVLSSEFILFKTKGLSVIWRQKMGFVGIVETHGQEHRYQSGRALIYPSGRSIWVVAPTKLPELAVYEVPLPEDEPDKSTSTIY